MALDSYSAYLLPSVGFKSKSLCCNYCNQCTHNCFMVCWWLILWGKPLICRAARSCCGTYNGYLFCGILKTNPPGYLCSLLSLALLGIAGRKTWPFIPLCCLCRQDDPCESCRWEWSLFPVALLQRYLAQPIPLHLPAVPQHSHSWKCQWYKWDSPSSKSWWHKWGTQLFWCNPSSGIGVGTCCTIPVAGVMSSQGAQAGACPLWPLLCAHVNIIQQSCRDVDQGQSEKVGLLFE